MFSVRISIDGDRWYVETCDFNDECVFGLTKERSRRGSFVSGQLPSVVDWIYSRVSAHHNPLNISVEIRMYE